MLTRITDRKIPCVYIHVYRITKNWGPGPYNSLRHADNRRYFSGLSLTRNRREAHMFYLAREVGKFGHVLAEKKSNFTMINEFKYGQTWKIWPSPLSLSLYNPFNRWVDQENIIYVKWNRIKNCAKTRMVIDRGKRSKTPSEVKPVENISKNLQNFLEISPDFT